MEFSDFQTSIISRIYGILKFHYFQNFRKIEFLRFLYFLNSENSRITDFCNPGNSGVTEFLSSWYPRKSGFSEMELHIFQKMEFLKIPEFLQI